MCVSSAVTLQQPPYAATFVGAIMRLDQAPYLFWRPLKGVLLRVPLGAIDGSLFG